MSVKDHKHVVQKSIGEPEAIVTLRVVVPDEPGGTGRWVTDSTYSIENPETGLTAVWLPGETVPEWAVPEELRVKRDATTGSS